MVLFVGCVVKMKAVLVVKKVGVQKRIFVKIISAAQSQDMIVVANVLIFLVRIVFYTSYGLIACLRKNESNGVIYHYPNSHLGDYDLESEEAIYHLILKGK